MSDTKIISIGRAVPSHRLTQEKALSFMKRHLNGYLEPSRVEALFRASSIENRYTVLEDYSLPGNYEFYENTAHLEPLPGTAKRMDAYRMHAPSLAGKAVKNCLKDTHVTAENITHLITVSCTGMYAPGLDIDLINELGMGRNIHRYNINFMGCYAALTAMRMGDSICRSDDAAVVLIVCVELCSLHYQVPKSEEQALSNALFGDGAASILMKNTEDQRGLRFLGSHTKVKTEGHSEMSWYIGDHGFLMNLSGYVPQLVKENISTFVEELLELSSQSDFDHIAVHPGGKKIVAHVGEQLHMNRELLSASYNILKQFGNMSSPTVLFVLDELLKKGVEPADRILALAFGPGLTFESILFQYD
jgi:predicted naringenin-chalcone synthase